MTELNDDILNGLKALEAGQLDTFTPEQVARLEEHLNADEAAAGRLAGQRPPADPVVQTPAATPSAEAWERAWKRIEAAARPASTRSTGRTLRLWGSAGAAAAAVLLAVGLWRWPAGDEWPVEWAQSIEIDDLEVLEGRTAFVTAAQSDEDVPVIWVLDGGG